MRPYTMEISTRYVALSSELLVYGVLQRIRQRWIRLPAFLCWVCTLVAFKYVVFPKLVAWTRKKEIPVSTNRRSDSPDPLIRILEEHRARQAISQQLPIIINSQEIPTSYNTTTRRSIPWCQVYIPNSIRLPGDPVPIRDPMLVGDHTPARGFPAAQDPILAPVPTQTRSKGTQTGVDFDPICSHGNWARIGCQSCAEEILGNVQQAPDPVPNRDAGCQTERQHRHWNRGNKRCQRCAEGFVGNLDMYGYAVGLRNCRWGRMMRAEDRREIIRKEKDRKRPSM